MADLAWAGLTALVHLAVTALVLGPVLWWRARRAGRPVLAPGGGRRLALIGLTYLGATLVLHLPRIGALGELAWNWQNKILLLGLLLVLIRALPGLSWRTVGVVRPRPGWLVPVVAVAVGTAAVLVVTGRLSGSPGEPAPGLETVLYQAIVPGLDEELLFRGVLLALAAEALPGRVISARGAMRGTAVGWEVPLTCLLFGLAHGVVIGTGWELQVEAGAILTTGLIGGLLAWFRMRWASLLPAVLTHNGINSAAVLAAYLT